MAMSGHLGDTHDLPRQNTGITNSYFPEKKDQMAPEKCVFCVLFSMQKESQAGETTF